MLFNSLHFLIFFPIVTGLYFLLPHRFRWAWLLAASSYFYMAFIPAYVLILYVTILIDYAAAILIERTEGVKRKRYLVLSIVANVGILFFFKYFNFFNSNIAELAQFLNWNYSIGALNIILPVGLSFHTFQAMSYTIEVYRGNQKAERHLGIYALYVMFFPQLVAGPIERPQNLLHQFYEKHRFDYKRVTDGLKLMGWGMFKKVVIADRLAVMVTKVYDNPYDFSGLTLLMATYFFAFQIYCDFSGYSDIARGSAKVLGINLMKNFDRPYFAKSISEFWRRWHISLCTWFRDYIYIPLGGNRVGKWRWYFNIFIVFLISGLWHGAAWTYVSWGAILGIFMICSVITRQLRQKISNLLGISKHPLLVKIYTTMVTFHLIVFSWIFFRAKSISDALYIVGSIISDANLKPSSIFIWQKVSLLAAFSGIIFLLIVQLVQRKHQIIEAFSNKHILIRWAGYVALIWAIFMLGEFGGQQFIYFVF